MTHWRVDPSLEQPPWRQVVEHVLDAVAGGAVAPGEALLSVRAMAAAAQVNHNTVARAYRDLEALGVVRGRNGRGVFVEPAGPGLAREQRSAETLERFADAVRDALRAGHDAEALRAAIESLAGEAPRRRAS